MGLRNITKERVVHLLSRGLTAEQIAVEMRKSLIYIERVIRYVQDPEFEQRDKNRRNKFAKEYKKAGRVQTPRETNRIYQKNYYQRNKQIIGLEAAERAERERKECFAAYGDCCACCGEDGPKFLTIDHIKNDGRSDRHKNGTGTKYTGTKLYAYLRSLGYPKDRYRLLCWNCNSGRAVNGGVCPHEEWGADSPW